MGPPTEPDPAPGATLACVADAGFAGWIAAFPGAVAVTTYQAGKVVLFGWDGSRVTVLPRHFDKPMGLAVAPPAPGRPARLALATRHVVTLFADAPLLAPDFFPDRREAYDALYLPRVSYHTGDLNAHDLAFAADGLWAVNTRFGCLARLSDEYSFVPAWKPPFVTELAPEDRCHLNGLCVAGGRPRYVTALGETDTPGGWRAGKATGGVVVDTDTGAVVVRGLAMPHSPRWHQDRLWVLNSGAGELLAVDPRDGRAETVAALPGYLRGLAFAGPHALVGLCQVRERHIFGGLPVQSRFPRLRCGVALVDLRSGRPAGLLEFTAGCTELFEVAVLPGPRRLMITNLDREETRQAFPAPGFAYWLRPANELPGPEPDAGRP